MPNFYWVGDDWRTGYWQADIKSTGTYGLISYAPYVIENNITADWTYDAESMLWPWIGAAALSSNGTNIDPWYATWVPSRGYCGPVGTFCKNGTPSKGFILGKQGLTEDNHGDLAFEYWYYGSGKQQIINKLAECQSSNWGVFQAPTSLYAVGSLQNIKDDNDYLGTVQNPLEIVPKKEPRKANYSDICYQFYLANKSGITGEYLIRIIALAISEGGGNITNGLNINGRSSTDDYGCLQIHFFFNEASWVRQLGSIGLTRAMALSRKPYSSAINPQNPTNFNLAAIGQYINNGNPWIEVDYYPLFNLGRQVLYKDASSMVFAVNQVFTSFDTGSMFSDIRDYNVVRFRENQLSVTLLSSSDDANEQIIAVPTPENYNLTSPNPVPAWDPYVDTDHYSTYGVSSGTDSTRTIELSADHLRYNSLPSTITLASTKQNTYLNVNLQQGEQYNSKLFEVQDVTLHLKFNLGIQNPYFIYTDYWFSRSNPSLINIFLNKFISSGILVRITVKFAIHQPLDDYWFDEPTNKYNRFAKVIVFADTDRSIDMLLQTVVYSDHPYEFTFYDWVFSKTFGYLNLDGSVANIKFVVLHSAINVYPE